MNRHEQKKTGSFYTDKDLIDYIFKFNEFPIRDNSRILEPSVGDGGFVKKIIEIIKLKKIKNIIIDVCDINSDVLSDLNKWWNENKVDDITINFINDDFLFHDFKNYYDLVIGNPPFITLKKDNYYKKLKNEFKTINTINI
ncbi:MAG: methyltransferase [Ureaplasma sp.]|nr:methyltransferase [Ureaplasma sp.]